MSDEPQPSAGAALDISGPASAEETVERVLQAAELVPSGQVVSYGDLAELCGTSPRRVGAVMRAHGHEVAWWRVTSSNGDHPLIDRALPFWQDEGIALKPNGRGCSMALFRTDLIELARQYEAARRHATMGP